MVYVHLAQGFEEVEALTCVDLLRRVGVETYMVSMTGKQIVTSVRNVGIQADLLFEEADYDKCDMIVLPGGMPGAKNLEEHRGLVQQIVGFAETGKWIAAICAAPMVLGHNGLLEGKKATIFPGMEEHLNGAKCSQDSVVIDGKVITSKGPGTAMEFALAMVGVLKGKETSDKLRNDLVL